MSNHEQPKEVPSNVYILYEEKEEAGIREFNILATAWKEADLIPLLEAKFEKDEYGIFGSNGVSYQSGTAVKSRYSDDGHGVEYNILEVPVLSKEQLQAMLKTSEYDTAFHCPDNLRDIVTDVFQSMVDDSYSEPDIQKVVSDVMQNKSYQSMIKQAWWATDDHIADHFVKYASGHTFSWLQDHLASHPNYFEEIGVQEPFACSEDLRNVLIDAIYDVSKNHRLYVNDVELEADRILANRAFRAIIRTLDTDHLDVGSEQHKHLSSACYDFVTDRLVPEEDLSTEPPRLRDRLVDAAKRQETQLQPAHNHPDITR